MDLAVVNAYALFKEITKEETYSKVSFKEFKQIVYKELSAEWRNEMNRDETFYLENHNKHYESVHFKDVAAKSIKSIDLDDSSSEEDSDIQSGEDDECSVDARFSVKTFMDKWRNKRSKDSKSSSTVEKQQSATGRNQLSVSGLDQKQLSVFKSHHLNIIEIPVVKNGRETKEMKHFLKENIVTEADDYSSFGCINSDHYLLKNKDGKDIGCFFCRHMGVKSRSRYLCAECGRAFHVDCFAAYHYQGALKKHQDVLCKFIDHIDTTKPEGNRNKSKFHRTFDDLSFEIRN